MNLKRIFAGAITILLLSAATASADPGNGNAYGPGFCGGAPGQGIVQFYKQEFPGTPPGQAVSNCNGHGHGANQGGGGGSGL